MAQSSKSQSNLHQCQHFPCKKPCPTLIIVTCIYCWICLVAISVLVKQTKERLFNLLTLIQLRYNKFPLNHAKTRCIVFALPYQRQLKTCCIPIISMFISKANRIFVKSFHTNSSFLQILPKKGFC